MASYNNSFDVGIKATKYSACIGFAIMFILFIKLIQLYLQENGSSYNVNTTHKNHICLYVNAFIVIISSFITTLLYFIYHSQFIELSDTNCRTIINIAGIFYCLTRSFYYNFMLFRVKSVFEKQSKLKVNTTIYYILIIFANSMLLTMILFGFLAFDY
eukprot:239310_1